jgi:hypothetical protein
MMATIGVAGPAIADTVAALTAAGLTATSEVRDAHPPCALVIPRSAQARTSCLVRLELAVLLISPGPAHGDAMAWLDRALAMAWQAIPHKPRATLGLWTSPHTGTPLLSYELVHILETRTEAKDG